MEKQKAKCSGYGMFTGIYWVIGLGIILGALLGIPFKAEGGWTPSSLATLLALGIALSYLVLSVLDWLVQWRSLAANPLPYDLALSDRAVAGERGTALKGGSPLQRHIRRLLAAWGAGASGPQVAAMAGSQMLRTLVILAAETGTILVLLIGSAGFEQPQQLLTLGSGLMLAVVLVSMARFQLASHLAGYIESHLLARIGNDTPAAAGVEFAQAVAKSVTDSTASLAAAQAKFAEQLSKAQEQAAALVAKAQQEAAAQVARSQQEASAQAAKVQTEMSSKLSATQEQAVAQLGKAQTEIATQLGRVTALASTIDNVLKLQQAVDGTLKGVAVTEEFKSTLVELKRHLAESDALLRNAAKPRSIRLVEKDNE
jgi:F0F1-type ATP synthase membrane subunit b/b'